MKSFRRRPRLQGFGYFGCFRYFITICAHEKRSIFVNEEHVAPCLKILKEKSEAKNFKVWAYCFMPDHLHLLIEGTSESADLKGFVSSFKQTTGYYHSQNVAQGFSPDDSPKLWQPSYYDHVLRNEEDLQKVAAYILNNPVRKGLVEHYREYDFSGSLDFGEEAIGAW